MAFQKGDLLRLGQRQCVVVGTESDEAVPEGHLAVWFGPTGEIDAAPEVWTVPAEYFERAPPPVIRH